MNAKIQAPDSQIVVKPMNVIDAFTQKLHDLVYSAAQINTEQYKSKGYETSKDSQGSIEIFKAEYNNIREEIRAFATDDILSSKKNILSNNISNAFTGLKSDLNLEKQGKILEAKRDNDLETKQIRDKIAELKHDKSILEMGNQNTGEKGLLQVNKEIERNKLERRTIEQSFTVKKFWSFGTMVVAFLLVIFTFYLSFFFASAFYKMLFESNEYRISSQAGIDLGLPKLVDANAIVKIFRQQGVLFGFVAAILFLFPILLSNVKLLGSKNKLVNGFLFWIGLAVFDVTVAGMIAINTDKINSLLIGKDPQMQIWEVVKHGEFWMIFMFGMVPLIITHYLIENITTAYRLSKRELVDAEKSKKIQMLDEEMIELNSEKEVLFSRISVVEDAIGSKINILSNLEIQINNIQNQIENTYDELQKQVKSIYDDFNNKIISGKIFTEVILDSVVMAYNSGFIEHLPKFYATGEVARRVREIEQLTINN